MEEEKKKTTFFVCVFNISPDRNLSKNTRIYVENTNKNSSFFFSSCKIKLRIQQVPTRHTFDEPRYPKNKKYLKNVMMMSSSHFFRNFLFLGYWGPPKICSVGNNWMHNLIMHPTSSLDQNFSDNMGIYVENTNKK